MLITSIQVRNPLIVIGGDHVLRLLLFWNLFLPWGACCSLDALRRPPLGSVRHFSVASAALLLQVAFIYVFSGSLKTDAMWHEEGSAVYWALHSDLYARASALAVRDAPDALLTAATRFVVAFESFAPLLLFLPVANAALRFAVLPWFVLLQAGFGIFLQLGIFPWISAAALLAFLPSRFWEMRRTSPQAMSTGLAPELQILAAVLFACVVLWNLSTMKGRKHVMPESLRDLARIARLDQRWNMFAPYPLQDDGWFLMAGRRMDGSTVDAWTGKPLDKAKPDVVSEQFPNHRWRKLMILLLVDDRVSYRSGLAYYLCRRAGGTLDGVDILFMNEIEEGGPYEREVLISVACRRADRDNGDN